MALIKCRSLMAIVALVAFLAGAGINGVAAQSSSVCSTPSLDLTPCLNIITGSSNGVPTGSPSKECCAAMQTAADGGVGCFCQLITTSNPLGLINKRLALTIPGLCRVKTQPLNNCEGTAGVPFTAPTASPGSILAPAPAEDLAPSSSSVDSPAPAEDLAPSSSSVDSPAKLSPSEISPSTDLSPASSQIQPGSSSKLSPTSLPVLPTPGVDVNRAYGVYLPSIVGSFAGLILTGILL